MIHFNATGGVAPKPRRRNRAVWHWLAAMGCLCGFSSSWAEAPPADPRLGNDDARRLLQDSNRRFDELIQQQRLRQLRHGGSGAQAETPAEPEAGRCLPVSALRLKGIRLLTHQEVSALGLPSGACLDVAELNRFSRALTARYIEKGYIAARVLAEGPDAHGVLTLSVEEGRVAAILSQDPGLRPGNLFPDMQGKPLNVHDLDQGLDQANRLRSNHVAVDVLPGAAVGDTVLQLSNRPDGRLSGGVSLDNTGRESTGRLLAGASLTWDNPTGWSDMLSLSAQATTANPAVRHSRSESLFYSLPYGYWTASVFASRSDYLNPQSLAYSTVQLSGTTVQGGMRLDRVLSRDQSQVLTADVQLTQKRVRNRFQDVELAISSPSLTVLELGLSQMRLMPGGVLQLDGGVQRGLRGLGADGRDARIPDAPDPQFLKIRFSASWGMALSWPGGPYQWQTTLAGQASRSHLPGVEQMDVADSGAVRGFRNNALASETGWYWRNTLSRRGAVAGFVLTPRLGLDGGRVLQRGSSEAWQDIAGMAAGLGLARGDWTLDLDYSRPLRKPQGWVAEGHILFARLNWQW
ncbi:ShlB/FhaC/HecB family hemolysin secretion/activation protein [Chromobacterium paludis]|uniref:ShlB/FhaC/HecB family hemolysin secretion/activation protein n=1 Tax=Chromobacterium paludis TaxID=2605945 RepID=A0A5C1DDT2_9NEIS|nr:ShlB/FhaC/HecB family hemolysin secretion/activation protein [Chromobacterium paludis]QEL54922.1 ShlB/FhaC/HecB family hemolysin secretion/activation protein [Chromobacterium paludis]